MAALGIVAYLAIGLGAFVVPSAWLHARGLPWWACAVVGALAFPLVPVGWHLLGERARRRPPAPAPGKAAPPPSTLTAGDRRVLRLVAVAAVALGPLLVLRPGQSWRAVRDHGTWFVPRTPTAPRVPAGDPRLLAEVPADAEVVVWVRSVDDLAAVGTPAAPAAADDAAADDDDVPDEGLFAYRDGDLVVVVRGSDKALGELDVAELNAELDAGLAAQDDLRIAGPLTLRRVAPDLVVIVTPGWAQAVDARHAGKAAGPTALIDRLGAAPADAALLFAAVPTRPFAGVRFAAAQAWLRVTDDTLELVAEATTDAPTTATALAASTRAELVGAERDVPAACQAAVKGLLGKLAITASGRVLSVRGRWATTQIGEAVLCGLGAAMAEDDEAAAEADADEADADE